MSGKFSLGHTRAAKLTADQVLEIRRLYHDERWSQPRLARMYNISSGQIGRIVRGESWQQYAMPPSDAELEHAAATSGYTPTAQELADSMAKLELLRSVGTAEPQTDLLEQVLKRRGGEDPLRRLSQETRIDVPSTQTPAVDRGKADASPQDPTPDAPADAGTD